MNTDDHAQPTPESLAAFVDGELTPPERASFERWLAENSDRRAELSAHRQLGRLWQSARPTEPDDETWTAALAGITARLPVPAVVHTRRGFPLRWLAGTAAGAAAVALIWILANRQGPPEPTLSPEREVVDLPFAVASPDDVEITSLWNADDDLLLVGRRPLQGPMELVDPGDVRIERVDPAGGTNIQISDQPGETPMIDMQTGAPKVK